MVGVSDLVDGGAGGRRQGGQRHWENIGVGFDPVRARSDIARMGGVGCPSNATAWPRQWGDVSGAARWPHRKLDDVPRLRCRALVCEAPATGEHPCPGLTGAEVTADIIDGADGGKGEIRTLEGA